jgi:hypothetical protein
MSNRVRNSLLGIFVIVLFILGTPFVQYVVEGAASTAGNSEEVSQTQGAIENGEAPFQVLKIGDNYFRVVPSGEQSVAVELYDSSFRLIAVNENEAALTFSLPDGDKEVLKISAPADTGCSMPGHSSGEGEGDCCPSGPATSQESCPS